MFRNPETFYENSAKKFSLISFYQLSESPAFGAAFMAARYSKQEENLTNSKNDSAEYLSVEKIEDIFREFRNKNRIFFDSF